MKKWMNSREKLGVVLFAATAVASCGAGAEAASGGFLTEVPAGDWSYEAVNELISAGDVPEYEVQIPAGRVMSRLEMAMIVDSVLQNEASLEPAQGEILGRLKREYYYDMKKLALLNRLDSMDVSAVESAASTQPVPSKELEDSLPFTKADKEKQDKMASFLDRFQISGRARIRNDHRIRENGGKKTRETVSNHINVWVDTVYKVNNNWKILTGLEYRNSMGSLNPEDIGPTVSEVDSKTPNPYLTLEGKFKNGLSVKVGKWYEWTPNGYGFDLDSDVVGGQVSFGKKLRTTISAVKFDLADYDEILALPYYTNVVPYLRANNKYANGTDGANFFGIRFDYPINQKNDIHFGVSWMSALPTQFQDPTVKETLIFPTILISDSLSFHCVYLRYSMLRISTNPVTSNISITVSLAPVTVILPCLFIVFCAVSSTRSPADEIYARSLKSKVRASTPSSASFTSASSSGAVVVSSRPAKEIVNALPLVSLLIVIAKVLLS